MQTVGGVIAAAPLPPPPPQLQQMQYQTQPAPPLQPQALDGAAGALAAMKQAAVARAGGAITVPRTRANDPLLAKRHVPPVAPDPTFDPVTGCKCAACWWRVIVQSQYRRV